MRNRAAVLVGSGIAGLLLIVAPAAVADAGPPSISDVTPASQAVGTTAQIGIDGTGFTTGGVLEISGSGITVTKVIVDSPTHVSAKVAVAADAPSGTKHGARTVTFSNPDGQSGSCTTCFAVVTPPTVTSMSPSSIAVGAKNFPVTITGSNFHPDVSLSTNAGFLVTFTVVSVTPTTISARASAYSHGSDYVGNTYLLSVTNGDGGTAQTTYVLTGKPKAKEAHNVVERGHSAAITITGTNFEQGLTVTSNDPDNVAFSAPTDVTATSFDTVVTASASAGTQEYDITIMNPDGGVGTSPVVFVTS